MSLDSLPVNIVYFGSPDFAVPALRALVAHPHLARVIAVVTQPDKPSGRGQKVGAPAVKIAAAAHDIPVFQPTTLRTPESQALLAAYPADLFVVAAYGKILPPAVLAMPRLGCVNLHASLLPKYRGAAPITHAILNGEAKTGVCLMQMEEGLDTGGVYAHATTPITDDDDAGTLTDRLAGIGAEVLIANLPELAQGTLVVMAQSQGETYAGKIKKEDGRIDWGKPAHTVFNHIRAFSPWPSAFAFLGEKRVQILKARATQSDATAAGTMFVKDSRLLVACAQGALDILELKPEGKRAMSAAEFLAGRPQLPAVLR